MAQRGGEYFLDRRIADGGNDKTVFYSRARGEDQLPTRRVADRGSGRVYSDPRDIMKIKRLQQRVRDLEEIQRLRKRVHDLELQREMRKAETESTTVVWDEGGDREQQPFSHHPHLFYEPIYQECIAEDGPRFDEEGPRFDEDEIGFEEEECLFLQNIFNGVTETIFNSCKVERGGSTVATNDEMAADGNQKVCLEVPLFLDNSTIELIIEPNNPVTIFQNEMDDQSEKSSVIGCILPNNYGDDLIFAKVMGDIYGNPHAAHLVIGKDNSKGRKIDNNEAFKDKLNANGGPEICSPLREILCASLLMFVNRSRLRSDVAASTNMGAPFDPGGLDFKVKLEDKFFLENGEKEVKKPNNPIDPGGTHLYPGEMTRKVERFGRVMMLINKEVPFDPGGFCSKAKLEDEFFRRWGV